MHYLNRDSAEERRQGGEAPALASVERLWSQTATSDLDRAERLRADTAEYATALKQQLDILVDAYDAALTKWTSERSALESQVETLSRLGAYVEELEQDILVAWDRIETLERQLGEETRNAAFFRRELDAANRFAAERERRLTVELFEAQQSEQKAIARADEHAAHAAAALRDADAAARRADEHRERADWATDERARLAKCYEDACLQASQIGKTVVAVEHEMSKALAVKDDEIATLSARCAELETTLLKQITASIQEARAESERLSALVNGVQQGRFWKVKRAAQRLRNLIRR